MYDERTIFLVSVPLFFFFCIFFMFVCVGERVRGRLKENKKLKNGYVRFVGTAKRVRTRILHFILIARKRNFGAG